MNRTWKSSMLVVIAVVVVSCAPPAAEEPEAAAEPAAEAADTGAEAEAQHATVADPDHYKVEHESDTFRILRITYGAGEESVMHYHPAHVGVFLTDLETEFVSPDGTTEAVQVEAGSHMFIPAGSHHPRNVGEPFEGVAIEIKATGADADAAAGADPAEVDPEHYKVEFENDQVRVLRISYGPGEESVMHYHGEHAGVALNDQTWSMTLGDGSTQEISLAAGESILAPAGDHLSRNAGEGAAEVIVVEVK